MFNSFFSGFVFFGVSLAVIFAILIWFKDSEHQRANRFLSVCLIISAVTYALYGSLYVIDSLAYTHKALFFLPLATELCILPPCYLYIRTLYQIGPNAPKVKIWLHLIAPAIGFVALIPVFLSEQKQLHVIDTWFANTYSQAMEPSVYLVGMILLSQLIGYFILNVRAHVRYRRFIQNIFSDLEAIKLGWVKGIIIIWAIYLCIHLFVFFGPIFLETKAFESFVYQFIGINIAFYLYIAIQAFNHSYVFSPKNIITVREYAKKEKRYKHSPLSATEAEDLKARLIDHLTDQKPYLESDLTITQLAQQLALTNSKKLSQVLNEVMQESFYQLINRYRAEESLRILQQDKARSMVDIAYQAGFKSVSTFYSHFKTLTGTTPSDYLKRLEK